MPEFERIEVPPEAGVKTIQSPAFPSNYPRVVGKGRMAPALLAALESVWAAQFAERLVEIIALRDVFVSGDGLVITRDSQVIERTVAQHLPERIEEAFRDLREKLDAGTLRTISGPTVLCVKPGWQNYGHWLAEMLPKAFVARRHVPRGLNYLVPDPTGRLSEVVAESLSSIGVASLLRTAFNEPVHVDELILVDGLTNHGGYMSPLVFEALERVAAAVAPADIPNIYIKRKSPAYRLVANEDEVEPLMLANGFTILSPEDFTFGEQIALFKGAKRVWGPAGAAATNIAFCAPGTEVTLFYPEGMSDTFYWFLAQHRGLSLIDVRCEQVTAARTVHPWDGDIRVDVEVLRGLL